MTLPKEPGGHSLKFKELDQAERSQVNQFYQLTTYQRPVSGSDRVFVAVDSGFIYGAVRIESAEDIQVLRGMYMHPDHLREGIGSKLLEFIEPVLAETDAYCIPGDHLFRFYGKAGFRPVQGLDAPGFLSDRVEKYTLEGKSVAIMFRPAGRTGR